MKKLESFKPLLLLTVLACEACGGGAGSVDAERVFPDSLSAALAEAVADGDRARIQQLIQAGADPNARGDQGTTMLQWGLLNKSTVGLETLLGAGADPALADSSGATVVHFAALANDPSYLDILLAHKADPNTPNGITRVTPLVSALMGNREVQFAKLLAAGAQPNRPDRMGDTPLHVAAKINAFDRVLDLLEAGADPTARNNIGSTFQRYAYQTPAKVMTDEALTKREAISAWLRAHNVPVEADSKR